MFVGILELNSSITYGRSSRNITKYLFRPFDKTLGLCVVGCSRTDRTSNILALITVENWEKTKLTNGILVEIIGKDSIDNFVFDIKVFSIFLIFSTCFSA